jgi:hypothetical protein
VKAAALLLLLLVPALLAAVIPAGADEGCAVTPTGIDCSAAGSSTSGGTTPGGSTPGLPLRYLATTEHPGGAGLCWFWSPTPPGLDSWSPANDQAILLTLWALPECPAPEAPIATLSTAWVVARAWEVFRSFPLAAPSPRLQPPDHGITGLPSYLSASLPARLSYRETLPDGRVLQVRARVTATVVDWGDGTPALGYDPAALLPYPAGGARHTYVLKTCPPDYRAGHPSGGNCHPTLAAYPVAVTFRWTARYRLGGSWIDLGDLDRSATVAYDVDELQFQGQRRMRDPRSDRPAAQFRRPTHPAEAEPGKYLASLGAGLGQRGVRRPHHSRVLLLRHQQRGTGLRGLLPGQADPVAQG